MANLSINGLSGSQVLKIKVAVVEIMEKSAGITITEDPDINQDAKTGICRMLFKKKETSFEELARMRERMGEKFDIKLVHQKDAIAIVLNAPIESFTALAHIQAPIRQATEPAAPGAGEEQHHEPQGGEGAK